MFLRDRTHKMLVLLNFAKKLIIPHPTLAFGRIFTHVEREDGLTSPASSYKSRGRIYSYTTLTLQSKIESQMVWNIHI